MTSLPPPQPGYGRGIVLMVAAMGCFSASDLLAKRLGALAAAPLPVSEIVWFRYLALGLSLLAVALWQRRPLPRSRRPGLQAARALGILGSALLFNAGLQRLPIATATALAFSSPLFVMALATLMLRERVRAAQWAWAGLGFAGVLLVARPSGGAALQPAVLWPIASSLAWAVAMVLTRRLAGEDEGFFVTQALSCAIGLALLSLALPWQFIAPPPAQWVELAAMAACWALAQWLVAAAYQGSAAARVAPFAYSQLLWAHGLGLALLGQVPATGTLLGSGVILLAALGAARAGR